jgi:pyroglutamyl-peptidase
VGHSTTTRGTPRVAYQGAPLDTTSRPGDHRPMATDPSDPRRAGSAGRPILVTGFGPFLSVAENPSGALARWADGRRFGDHQVVGQVLRVAFAGLPEELERAVTGCIEPPCALVSLGVQREAWWRLERRARRPLTSVKCDVDGELASGFDADAPASERHTRFDLDRLCGAIADLDLPARASDDAGGYVCEWCYDHLLGHGERLGVPALFVHVPPHDAFEDEVQERALGALLGEVARIVAEGGDAAGSTP